MIGRIVSQLAQQPRLIRFRLTLWYTGLVALVLAVFVGSVGVAFSQYQFSTYDEALAASLRQTFNQQVQIAFPNANDCPFPTEGRNRVNFQHNPCIAYKPLVVKDSDALNQGDSTVRFVSLDGRPLPAINGKTMPPAAVGSAFNSRTVKTATKDVATNAKSVSSVNVGNLHFVTLSFTTKDGDRVIGQIAQPIAHIQSQVDALRLILIFAAGILLIISAVGGWFLAGRALKPIDELTRRARQITINDLSQRLNLDQEDELGRMAETFDDMIARLEEAFERQKRFTSDASHELRTPLTVMQADIGLALARPRTTGEYRQTLVSMEEEVVRLSAIVNDLLTLTRIDVDPAGMQHQPVALNELVAGLCKRVRAVAADRDIAVIFDRLEPVTVNGDSTRLRQLFGNLLDNAVTYTPDGGAVTVSVERTRDGARVKVGDTGIGIDPAHLPRIFERFYRTAEAREQNAHGTGLGLAISRSVVQAHHGEISVQSVPHQGTTFTVSLPFDGRKPVRRIHGIRALVPSAIHAR